MSTEQDEVLKCKIIIIGESGVGKTSLMNRFCRNEFNVSGTPTVGVNIEHKSIQISDKMVQLQIWDTAGQERYRALSKLYIRDSIGVVFVYDVTVENTLFSIQKWIDDVEKVISSNIVKVLVGNKCDNVNLKIVSAEEGKLVADHFGMFFFEASSKEDKDVSPIFNYLASKIVDLHQTGAIKLTQETSNIALPKENDMPKNNSSCCSK